MTIKRIGIQDGREVFEATLRKNHVAEDYAEMVRIAERSNGKRRFKIFYDGFTNKQIKDLINVMLIDNNFRNSFVRNNTYVKISSIAFVKSA